MSGHRRDTTKVSRTRRYVALVVAVLVLLIAAMIWFLRPDPKPPAAAPPATTAPQPSAFRATGPCASPAAGEFTPTKVTVSGVFRNAPVLALPRDSHNVPSIPPVTETGKREVAWDRPPGIRPGSPTGNVLLNVHTWPDGTALGNELLKGLKVGGRIIVRNADEVLCYRVEKRTEVPTGTLIPALYETGGSPQLVIIACSGKRLGPANWTKRTLWYAVPEPAASTSG
ncbi:MAG: hypothetical protein JWR83_2187 [Aeromicrobium sp.]|nr:hypothetical protein [Aeromicrobium sp.]